MTLKDQRRQIQDPGLSQKMFLQVLSNKLKKKDLNLKKKSLHLNVYLEKNKITQKCSFTSIYK